MRSTFYVSLVAISVFALFPKLASADPLPGETLKFSQLPLNNGALPDFRDLAGAPFPGHDELSTATLIPSSAAPVYQGTYMADDFADHFLSPVVHIRWWGSYSQDFTGLPTNPGVKKFLIAFEKDVPAQSSTDFSRPGEVLSTQIVTLAGPNDPLHPGSGTFTEQPLTTPPPPPGAAPFEKLYQYNAELNLGKEFHEHPETVYWLKIVALVDPQKDGAIQWGWHNRDWSIPDPLASTPASGVSPGEGQIGVVGPIPPLGGQRPVFHFQDDAVSGPVTITADPTGANMPIVVQDGASPKHYVFPLDGPESINQFSKDLAFQLYTRVPEPSSVILMGLGGFALAAIARRRK